MNKNLVYIPVFRSLQEEFKVLKSFDFDNRIYPCLEIVKELDRLSPPPTNTKKISAQKKPKRFEDVYIPLIQKIKAQKVFVDLPIHIKEHGNMKPEILLFLRTVVGNRQRRTEYLKKLDSLSSKIIPVISSYYSRTNERNTILLQAQDLRSHFNTLAFRTTFDIISTDFSQISASATAKDYLIVDWDNNEVDRNNVNLDVVEKLEQLNCTVVIHKNAIPSSTTNTGLEHNKVVLGTDNGLLNSFKDLGAHCFSDYCGIKKHNLGKGGSVSPGFIYFDAVRNKFYGFKGNAKVLSEFPNTIVPAILNSSASKRMHEDDRDFLGADNLGWEIINNIKNKLEPGQSAPKFKRIGLEHYLHCLSTKIRNGDFD